MTIVAFKMKILRTDYLELYQISSYEYWVVYILISRKFDMAKSMQTPEFISHLNDRWLMCYGDIFEVANVFLS